LPLRFSSYARALKVDLDALRREAIRRARTPHDPASGAKPAIAPDFGPVLDALLDLGAAGEAADRAADAVVRGADAAAAQRISEALLQVERAFLNPEGLPKRAWFRHVLIAPGTTTGYAPWPFPGLQQAIEDRDAALFAAESKKVIAALKAGAERLRAAAATQ